MRAAFAGVALVLSCVAVAGAQVIVQHEFLPATVIGAERPGSALPDPLEYTVHRTEIVAQLPTILSYRQMAGGRTPGLIWTNRVAYEVLRPDVQGGSAAALFADADAFHALDFRTSLTSMFSRNWTVTTGVGINLAVDTFDGASLSDATYAGAVILQHTFDSGWVLGGGGFYSQLTGRSTFLPNLYVGFERDRYRLKIALPASHLWYDATPRIALGVRGELDGDEYRLVGTTADLFDRDGSLVQEDTDVNLSYSRIAVGPAINVLFGALEVRFESGMAFQRTFEFRATEEDETLRFSSAAPVALVGRPVDYGLESNVYARIRLKLGRQR